MQHSIRDLSVSMTRRKFLSVSGGLLSGFAIEGCGGGSSFSAPPPKNVAGTYSGVARGVDASGQSTPGLVDVTIHESGIVEMLAVDQNHLAITLGGSAEKFGGTFNANNVGNFITFGGEVSTTGSISGRWIDKVNGSSGVWYAHIANGAGSHLITSKLPVIVLPTPPKLPAMPNYWGGNYHHEIALSYTQSQTLSSMISTTGQALKTSDLYRLLFVLYGNGREIDRDWLFKIYPDGVSNNQALSKIVATPTKDGYYFASPPPVLNNYYALDNLSDYNVLEK